MQIIFKNIACEKTSNVIPDDQWTILKISKEDLNSNNFIEYDESEISFYGKMYDIYKKEFAQDYLILYCFSDENENALNTAFDSYVSLNLNPNCESPVAKVIKQLINIEYIPNQPVTTFLIQ
jgi:hypothetical protein